MDLTRLIKEVEKRIPERYKQNPVKERIEYLAPPRAFYNFNPYKNNGKVLPEYYQYIDRESGRYIIPRSKGEQYIPEMLYWINFHKEYDMLAPFIILVCMEDLRGEIQEHNLLEWQDNTTIYNEAKKIITVNQYPLPNPRCIRVLPLYFENGLDEVDKYIKEGVPFKNEEALAEALVEIFDACLKKYDFEYMHFSDTVCENAIKWHQNYQDALMRIITGEIEQKKD